MLPKPAFVTERSRATPDEPRTFYVVNLTPERIGTILGLMDLMESQLTVKDHELAINLPAPDAKVWTDGFEQVGDEILNESRSGSTSLPFPSPAFRAAWGIVADTREWDGRSDLGTPYTFDREAYLYINVDRLGHNPPRAWMSVRDEDSFDDHTRIYDSITAIRRADILLAACRIAPDHEVPGYLERLARDCPYSLFRALSEPYRLVGEPWEGDGRDLLPFCTPEVLKPLVGHASAEVRQEAILLSSRLGERVHDTLLVSGAESYSARGRPAR